MMSTEHDYSGFFQKFWWKFSVARLFYKQGYLTWKHSWDVADTMWDGMIEMDWYNTPKDAFDEEISNWTD